MWFLLIKIFFLLALAALLGAAVAWWWMRRRFVDVTESHSELTRQVDAFLAQGKALSQEDVVSALRFALASYSPPQPDLQPLHSKLSNLEYTLAAPDQDMQAMDERLNGIEQSVSAISAAVASLRTVQLEAIDQHLRGVSARIDNLRMPDMEPVNTRIAALASHIDETRAPDPLPALDARLERIEQLVAQLQIPETDLGPVHSGLAALQVAVENLELPEPDLAPLKAQIEAFQGRIDDLTLASQAREEEIDAMLQRAVTLEQAVRDIQFPEPDLDPVVARLAQLESRIAAGPSPDILVGTLAGIESDLDVLSRRNVDLDPVLAQLAAVDASLSAIRTEMRGQSKFEVLERRIGALQDTIQSLPRPDYARLDHVLRTFETSIDLSALEDRLTAIEYGLTAVHHTLRSRPESVRTDAGTMVEARGAPRAVRTLIQDAPPPPRSRTVALTAQREGDEANLLTHAAYGKGDDLEEIVGVGPMLAELLHDVGVYYFWQIAEWTPEDVAYVDDKLLHFKGRIERDNWVGQAREFALRPGTARRPGDE